MKGLVFDGKLNLPPPSKGEVLIRVLMSGMCNTDIEITKEYKGIPGHEFVGIVEAVNVPDQTWLGKKVVGEINCACNR
jgi:threonine dehydrogenase-like Zn-dependent dehydrogenase